MDAQLAASSKPPPFHPPSPPAPVTSEYGLGRGDPPRGHDAGSGRWNSSPKEAGYIALGTAIVAGLPVAYGAIGDDATKHLIHHFATRAPPMASTSKAWCGKSLRRKTSMKTKWPKPKICRIASRGSPRYPLAPHAERYNLPEESKNWYYAIGGYSVWGGGTAVVSEAGAQRQFELDFEYSFFDRYNWDKGKSVRLQASPSPISSWASFIAIVWRGSLIAWPGQRLLGSPPIPIPAHRPGRPPQRPLPQSRLRRQPWRLSDRLPDGARYLT
jgi:hypothetical protein